jgi:hypothetical protein
MISQILGKTHVPLKAPTGLRTGATTVSIIRCEVWKPRREAEIWAGRANAALRSAEGKRADIVVRFGEVFLQEVCCSVVRSGLFEWLIGCLPCLGRVRVEMLACLLELEVLGWSAPMRCAA